MSRDRTVQGLNGPVLYHVHANGHVRDLFPVVYDDAVGWRRATEKEAERFYQEGFEYLGWVYSTSDFERAGSEIRALGFDGVATDSYFSATVTTSFDRDGNLLDGVIVGRIHW